MNILQYILKRREWKLPSDEHTPERAYNLEIHHEQVDKNFIDQ